MSWVSYLIRRKAKYKIIGQWHEFLLWGDARGDQGESVASPAPEAAPAGPETARAHATNASHRADVVCTFSTKSMKLKYQYIQLDLWSNVDSDIRKGHLCGDHTWKSRDVFQYIHIWIYCVYSSLPSIFLDLELFRWIFFTSPSSSPKSKPSQTKKGKRNLDSGTAVLKILWAAH